MHVPFRFKVLTQNGLEFLLCRRYLRTGHGTCVCSAGCVHEPAGASSGSHARLPGQLARACLPRGPLMKRPCSGAQLSRSSMFHRFRQMCLMPCRQAFPPIRVVPCVDMGCARCREGRGGYQFPFLGTFSRRSVLVAPGTSPSDAWEQYHANAATLSGIEVLGLFSRLWPTDFLPSHADRLVQHVRHQRHPRGVTPNQPGVVHTSAFSGSRACL